LAIAVRDSTEFQRLLHAIALELVDANIAFRMHADLIAAYESGSGNLSSRAGLPASSALRRMSANRLRRLVS
jgi:hypothetical protein